VRDVEIATIYEGTNGIQALDFAGRKLLMREGAPVRELLEKVGATSSSLAADPRLGGAAQALGAALGEIQSSLAGLMQREDAIELTLLNAVPILDMFGTILGGQLLLDQAAIARDKLAGIASDAGVDASDREQRRKLIADDPEAAFYHNKVETAIYYAHRALPNVAARAAAIQVGERSALEAEM
jgi:alkylation response protein AidB-like acyl-CoA dehydrogenase